MLMKKLEFGKFVPGGGLACRRFSFRSLKLLLFVSKSCIVIEKVINVYGFFIMYNKITYSGL